MFTKKKLARNKTLIKILGDTRIVLINGVEHFEGRRKMRQNKLLLIVVCAVFTFGVVGCSQKPKSANSGDAIQQSKNLKTVEEQVKYLVGEANAYISSEKFDESISIAKYILAELDKGSVDAKGILEKAQAELKALAEKKVEEAKAELKKKMDSLGR